MTITPVYRVQCSGPCRRWLSPPDGYEPGTDLPLAALVGKPTAEHAGLWPDETAARRAALAAGWSGGTCPDCARRDGECPVDRDPDYFHARIQAERAYQDSRWGPQNHPDGTGLAGDHDAATEAMTEWALVFAAWPDPCPDGTWAHIWRAWSARLLAEVDPDRLRHRLVKMGAIAHAWDAAIERRVGR